MSNDAAAFALATDRMIASPKGAFDAGLQPGQLPRPSRQPATGPPGSYPDRTHTGKRRRASDQNTILDDHLLITGRTPAVLGAALIGRLIHVEVRGPCVGDQVVDFNLVRRCDSVQSRSSTLDPSAS